ncbi:MAG TPA: hypothetical protein VFS27_13095 [Blastocatellia bacterium]|jgi:hypothetical protein|nr:hypothetical protein [Blastocatellia bacterium]
MRNALLTGLLILGFFNPGAQDPKPEIIVPMSAKEPSGFAPKGWEIEALKEGDLNDDKIDDAAIVIRKKMEKQEEGGRPSYERFLVLAFRRDGRLERSALSDAAVLDTEEGGWREDPFSELTINGGVVIIEQRGGGTMQITTTHCYRWQQNRWMLIGFTVTHIYGRADLYESYERDANLSIGLVETSSSSSNPQTGDDIEPLKEGSHYELLALTTELEQKIDGLFDDQEWPRDRYGYVLRLNSRKQIARNARLWKGVSDLSAVLNAVRRGEDIYVRAKVTDNRVSAGDTVRLVNIHSKGGRVIAPRESKTVVTDKGYNFEARYSMQDLGEPEPDDESASDLKSFLNDNPPDIRFSVVVEVIDVDGAARRASLSTKVKGSSYNSVIRTCNEDVVTLGNGKGI